MAKKHLTTTLCVNLEMDKIGEQTINRLDQILSRDSRVIKKYLNLIKMYGNKIFERKVSKKSKKITFLSDSSALDKLTLTTRDRKTVKHDLKKQFQRISHNELAECRDTAIGMYKSYLQLRETDKSARPPNKAKYRFVRTINYRRFTIDEENKTISLLDSFDTNLKMIRDKKNKTRHNQIKFSIRLSQYHIDKMNEFSVQALRIRKTGKNHYVADFSLRNDRVNQRPFKPLTKNKNKIAFVGIDLGIKRDAVLAVYSLTGKIIGEKVITNDRIVKTKFALAKLSRRISDLQRTAALRRRKHFNADGIYGLLKILKRKRAELKHEICHQVTAEIVLYIKYLEVVLGLDLFIAVGQLKGLRKKQRKGNGKKQLRKAIHNFAFSKMTQMIEYKLAREGYKKRILTISEAYTSSKCWKCNKKGRRPNQSLFYCANQQCHWRGNADFNGAVNIAKRSIKYFKLTNKKIGPNGRSSKVRVQGVAKTMPADRRVTRPKARTMDNMISLKTRKPAFYDSLGKDEKQTDAIIELNSFVRTKSIKTTCSSNCKISEDEGRPSLVVAERVNH